MKIGIDIRPLMDKEYSGVSWYTLDLLTEILRQDRQNEYVLYYNSGRDISNRISELACLPARQGFQNSDNVKIAATHYPNKIFNYFLQKIFHWPKLDAIAAKNSPPFKGGGRGGQPPSFIRRGLGVVPQGGVDVFWQPHFNFANFSRNCRVVLTVPDLSFISYPEFFSARKNFWHKFLGVRKLIERADIIVAISENTRQDIIRYFSVPADKIKMIYAGVGAEFRPLRRSPAAETATGQNDLELASVKNKYGLPEKFILNIGTFEPRKNLAGLIGAFDAVADLPGMGEWHLVLAGSGGWKNKEIFKAIDKAKNKARINIIGYIKKDERAALYNLAEIFAYPSFYEGFGLPVLEAMASGTPVITSAVSSLPEVTGDAALLVDPHDENSIAKALQILMQDEKLRGSYSARGLERAKDFSWKKTAREYLEIFADFCHPEEKAASADDEGSIFREVEQ
ncbi:MAG: glycosyltransferase family 1 protein [Patescibacteria group bacterium]|nr:glycosyltransferase family 1 protein [Patescibacteria group bacterium]